MILSLHAIHRGLPTVPELLELFARLTPDKKVAYSPIPLALGASSTLFADLDLDGIRTGSETLQDPNATSGNTDYSK